MGLLIFAVALGFGEVVIGHAAVLRALNWIGAAVLLWLAWRIGTASGGAEAAEKEPVGFTCAALFQWVNPKSWLVSTSAAGAYLHADAGSLAQALLFAALFIAAALPSGFLWLAFGASMQRFLRSARANRIFNIAMGASLAASVVMILW